MISPQLFLLAALFSSCIPFLQNESFPWDTVPSGEKNPNLTSEWAVHRILFRQDTSSCSDMGSSPGHCGLQGNLCSSAHSTSSYPSSLTLVLTRLSLTFSPSSSTACAFLKCTFPEVPPPWLQGIAMPCSGCAGICWSWRVVALAALQRGCLAVLAASTWAQTPPTIM